MKKIIFLLAILFLLPASIAQADNISDCLKKAQDNFTQSVKDSANDAFLQKFDALVWKDDSLKPVRDVFNTAKAKALKKKNDTKALKLFENSYKLYTLFWGLNLGVAGGKDTKSKSLDVDFINEKGEEKSSSSVFSKLGSLVQKAIDCCKE